MRKFGIAAALSASALVAVAVLVVGVAPRFSGAADHLEAPFVATDGRIDINDVYAFQSPADPTNTVLIMTVNPVAGVLSPTALRPGAFYEFAIDNDGDDMEDIVYRVQSSAPNKAGVQNLILHKATGAKAAAGDGGPVIAKGKSESTIPVRSGGDLFVGLRDDPFFFDLVAFLDQVKGAGGGRTFCDGSEVDFFAGLNVTAIVLEVPSSDLTGDTIGVWGRIKLDESQVERMGIPVIATVLIPDSSEDAYNLTVPADDVATWSADVEASLSFLSGLDGSGYSAGEAAFIASLLLPDVLTLDTSSSAGFVPGLNGRQLADDVVDFELFVVTGGLGADNPPAGTAVLDSDCVDVNDVPFSSTFPYVADPH